MPDSDRSPTGKMAEVEAAVRCLRLLLALEEYRRLLASFVDGELRRLQEQWVRDGVLGTVCGAGRHTAVLRGDPWCYTETCTQPTCTAQTTIAALVREHVDPDELEDGDVMYDVSEMRTHAWELGKVYVCGRGGAGRAGAAQAAGLPALTQVAAHCRILAEHLGQTQLHYLTQVCETYQQLLVDGQLSHAVYDDVMTHLVNAVSVSVFADLHDNDGRAPQDRIHQIAQMTPSALLTRPDGLAQLLKRRCHSITTLLRHPPATTQEAVTEGRLVAHLTDTLRRRPPAPLDAGLRDYLNQLELQLTLVEAADRLRARYLQKGWATPALLGGGSDSWTAAPPLQQLTHDGANLGIPIATSLLICPLTSVIGTVEPPCRVLVCGKAGSGKSWLVRHLAAAWAAPSTTHLGRLHTYSLLLYLRATTVTDLPADLSHQLGVPQADVDKMLAWNPGHVILIIDGINEASELQKKLIDEAIRVRAAHNMVVICTSRHGTVNSRHYNRLYRVEDIDLHTVTGIVGRCVQDDIRKAYIEQLYQKTDSIPKGEFHIWNPFMVSLLCYMGNVYSIPEDFHNTTDIFCSFFDAMKQKFCEDSLFLELETDRVIKEIGKLIYLLYKYDENIKISQTDLEKYVTKDKKHTIVITRMCHYIPFLSQCDNKHFYVSNLLFAEFLMALSITKIKRDEKFRETVEGIMKQGQRYMRCTQFVFGICALNKNLHHKLKMLLNATEKVFSISKSVSLAQTNSRVDLLFQEDSMGTLSPAVSAVSLASGSLEGSDLVPNILSSAFVFIDSLCLVNVPPEHLDHNLLSRVIIMLKNILLLKLRCSSVAEHFPIDLQLVEYNPSPWFHKLMAELSLGDLRSLEFLDPVNTIEARVFQQLVPYLSQIAEITLYMDTCSLPLDAVFRLPVIETLCAKNCTLTKSQMMLYKLSSSKRRPQLKNMQLWFAPESPSRITTAGHATLRRIPLQNLQCHITSLPDIDTLVALVRENMLSSLTEVFLKFDAEFRWTVYADEAKVRMASLLQITALPLWLAVDTMMVLASVAKPPGAGGGGQVEIQHEELFTFGTGECSVRMCTSHETRICRKHFIDLRLRRLEPAEQVTRVRGCVVQTERSLLMPGRGGVQRPAARLELQCQGRQDAETHDDCNVQQVLHGLTRVPPLSSVHLQCSTCPQHLAKLLSACSANNPRALHVALVDVRGLAVLRDAVPRASFDWPAVRDLTLQADGFEALSMLAGWVEDDSLPRAHSVFVQLEGTLADCNPLVELLQCAPRLTYLHVHVDETDDMELLLALLRSTCVNTVSCLVVSVKHSSSHGYRGYTGWSSPGGGSGGYMGPQTREACQLLPESALTKWYCVRPPAAHSALHVLTSEAAPSTEALLDLPPAAHNYAPLRPAPGLLTDLSKQREACCSVGSVTDMLGWCGVLGGGWAAAISTLCVVAEGVLHSTSHSSQPLAAALTALPALEDLSLYGLNLSAPGHLTPLAAALPTCPALTALSLVRCSVPGATLAHELVGALRARAQPLAELYLWDELLPQHQLDRLADNLCPLAVHCEVKSRLDL